MPVHAGRVPDAPTALILHPEPDKGGTMNNRVTYALYQHFQSRGFAVMRFNFRGVGRSQGTYDSGEANFPTRRPPWTGCSRRHRDPASAGLPASRSDPGSACS